MIARSRWKASSRKVPSPVRKPKKFPSRVIISALRSSPETFSAPMRFTCFTITLACSLMTNTTSSFTEMVPTFETRRVFHSGG